MLHVSSNRSCDYVTCVFLFDFSHPLDYTSPASRRRTFCRLYVSISPDTLLISGRWCARYRRVYRERYFQRESTGKHRQQHACARHMSPMEILSQTTTRGACGEIESLKRGNMQVPKNSSFAEEERNDFVIAVVKLVTM